jgi:hypothetical protein
VAFVDDAEAIAFGIREDHEIGVFRVQLPVDPFGPQRDEPLDLGGLIASIICVEIQMHAWMFLRRRLAETEGEVSPRSLGGHEHRPFFLRFLARDVVKSVHPEVQCSRQIRYAQYDRADTKHD